MESVLESHGPRESLELLIVQIGLETTELRVEKCKSILWLGAGTSKVDSLALNAYDSPNFPPLATVGVALNSR